MATIAIAPEELTTVISSWVGAFVLVASVIAVALAKLLPMIADIKRQLTELFARHEANKEQISDNKKAIVDQQAQIVNVALATPAEKKD